MYERILVPVDGSAVSNGALDEAIRLAKEAHAELRLINVLDETLISWGWVAGVDLKSALSQAGQETMGKALSRVREAGLDAESVLPETVGRRIESVIINEAKRWPAKLIVMGTHGRRGMDHLMLGSVAEGVARLSPVPVLLVRGTHAQTALAPKD
jgi:nucleotide-binding universal stress UspA family protein